MDTLMKILRFVVLVTLVAFPTRVTSLLGQTTAGHTLAVFYVVPSGIAYEKPVHERIIDATLDIQAWYQCATGGLTWQLAFPEVVHVYFADQTREFYRDNGDWWGSLLGEMGSKGLPIWSPGTVTAIWARGAGFWAGAAQGCGEECGTALLGVEAFPEFNNPDWSGAQCPDGAGVAAWPCTPEGAFAHELGHTLGLLHPFDVPATSAVAFHSIMQTHWNYPNFAPASESPWGFLTLERQTVHVNPFMYLNINLFQSHPGCDVVNLPDNGPVPTAAFELSNQGLSVSTVNNSVGATLYYWTFGDGTPSNDLAPMHIYAQPGTYTVGLRASGDDSMMALAERTEVLGACPAFPVRSRIRQGPGGNDDEFKLKGTFTLSPTSNGISPTTENVTLRIGTFSASIPAGSFQFEHKRRFRFAGTINQAKVVFVIQLLGKNRFGFSAKASQTDLTGTVNPAPVKLIIGDDTWCVGTL